MRKLIAQEWLSVDGFAADENGTTEFFGESELHTDSDKDILRGMDSIDTIILGANTYRLFVDFWPTSLAEGELIAPRLNETPKVVFSNSMKDVTWGRWNNAIVQNGDAVESLRKLKKQEGKDMVLWGSLSLFRNFLQAGLIDVLEIRTIPVILGKGIRLFEASDEVRLKTIDTKSYSSGIGLVRYNLV